MLLYEMSKNEDITYKNMAAANAVLGGKFIAVDVYLKWRKISSQWPNLPSDIGKEEQIKPNASRGWE